MKLATSPDEHSDRKCAKADTVLPFKWVLSANQILNSLEQFLIKCNYTKKIELHIPNRKYISALNTYKRIRCSIGQRTAHQDLISPS